MSDYIHLWAGRGLKTDVLRKKPKVNKKENFRFFVFFLHYLIYYVRAVRITFSPILLPLFFCREQQISYYSRTSNAWYFHYSCNSDFFLFLSVAIVTRCLRLWTPIIMLWLYNFFWFLILFFFPSLPHLPPSPCVFPIAAVFFRIICKLADASSILPSFIILTFLFQVFAVFFYLPSIFLTLVRCSSKQLSTA